MFYRVFTGEFYACRRSKITLKKRRGTYKERDEEKRKQFVEELEKIPEKIRIEETSLKNLSCIHLKEIAQIYSDLNFLLHVIRVD